MNKQLQTIVWIVIVLLIIWAVYALSQQSAEEEEVAGPATGELIKIGVIGPLTGNLAFLGEGLREAVLLAQESLEDTYYNYEVIIEDDRLDPKVTASAANKLISIDKVDALISISSGTGNVVTPIAEQNKIVHFGIASDPNVAKGDYNFIHWTPPAEENKVFVEELKKRDIEKIGIFQLNQQGVIAMVNDLRPRLEQAGIEIVTEQTFNFGEKDFKSLISKAQQSDAELYLLLAFSPELEILAKQIKDLRITTALSSIEAFELTEQRELFEGEWYVNAADPSGDFEAAFKEKTGKNPTMGAANGYDIVNLIVAAAEKIKSAEKPTPGDIAQKLMKIENFSGALGNLTVGEDGIVISKAVVRMIKDGQPITISD